MNFQVRTQDVHIGNFSLTDDDTISILKQRIFTGLNAKGLHHPEFEIQITLLPKAKPYGSISQAPESAAPEPTTYGNIHNSEHAVDSQSSTYGKIKPKPEPTADPQSSTYGKIKPKPEPTADPQSSTYGKIKPKPEPIADPQSSTYGKVKPKIETAPSGLSYQPMSKPVKPATRKPPLKPTNPTQPAPSPLHSYEAITLKNTKGNGPYSEMNTLISDVDPKPVLKSTLKPTPTTLAPKSVSVLKPQVLSSRPALPPLPDRSLDLLSFSRSYSPDTLDLCPFFHLLNRDEAFKKMAHSPNFSFLIRPASSGTGFTLEIVVRGELKKVSLEANPQAIWITQSALRFTNIGELLFHGREFFKDPIHSDAHKQRIASATFSFSHKNTYSNSELHLHAKPHPTSTLTPTQISQALLNFSAANQFYPVASLLRLPQCDPNIYDQQTGNTPLHFAVQNQNPEMVQELLRKGANPSLVNWKGQNVFNFCLGTQPCLQKIADDIFKNEIFPGQYVSCSVSPSAKVLTTTETHLTIFNPQINSIQNVEKSLVTLLPGEQQLELVAKETTDLRNFLNSIL